MKQQSMRYGGKHHITPVDRRPAAARQDYTTLQITLADVIAVIKAFPAGSSGGPDGVRQQHIGLMNMMSYKENGHALIASITSFVTILFEGNCHHDVIPIFFGGRL